MFAQARRLLDGSLVVTLPDAAEAMKLAAGRHRVIVEGASACAVAIVSGGNFDLDRFAHIVTAAA